MYMSMISCTYIGICRSPIMMKIEYSHFLMLLTALHNAFPFFTNWNNKKLWSTARWPDGVSTTYYDVQRCQKRDDDTHSGIYHFQLLRYESRLISSIGFPLKRGGAYIRYGIFITVVIFDILLEPFIAEVQMMLSEEIAYVGIFRTQVLEVRLIRYELFRFDCIDWRWWDMRCRWPWWRVCTHMVSRYVFFLIDCGSWTFFLLSLCRVISCCHVMSCHVADNDILT